MVLGWGGWRKRASETSYVLVACDAMYVLLVEQYDDNGVGSLGGEEGGQNHEGGMYKHGGS